MKPKAKKIPAKKTSTSRQLAARERSPMKRRSQPRPKLELALRLSPVSVPAKTGPKKRLPARGAKTRQPRPVTIPVPA